MNVISQIEGGAKRLGEIVAVLARYGIADWLNDVENERITKHLVNRDGEELTHRSTEERVRLALTELGTSAIKLGQMLSTRPDVIGSALALELSKLQANTPPDPWETVLETLKEELGGKLEENFYSINKEPMASASIGQVHAGELIAGNRVVVKVIHQGIIETILRDLDIVMFLAELMEKHSPLLRQYRPNATARYFKKTLLRELDFTYEKQYLEQFTKNFAEDPSVHFPGVFPDLSTSRVLTMELMEGIPFTDQDAIKEKCRDLTGFTKRGANVFMKMIFEDGFYHADPHPGNLFLLPADVVGIVDCGMVGRIDENYREDVEGMMLAAAANDAEEMANIICDIAWLPSKLDRTELVSDLADILSDYAHQSLEGFDLTGVLTQITDLIRNYKIVLPQGFAMIIKTLIMLEGTAHLLKPDFSIAELLRPYHRKALRRRFDPKTVSRKAEKLFREWSRLFEMIPGDLSDILSRFRKGSFEIHLEHRSLERTVDRLVKGILTASVFLGSSLLLSFEVSPTIKGISVVGVACFGTAVYLGFNLFRKIRKNTKRRD